MSAPSPRWGKTRAIWAVSWLTPLVACFATYGHSSPAQDVPISAIFGIVAIVAFLVPLFIVFLARLVRAVDRTVGIATSTPSPLEIQALAKQRLGRNLTAAELEHWYAWYRDQQGNARTQLALLGGLYFVTHEHGS